jgi:ferrous iron transport protein A
MSLTRTASAAPALALDHLPLRRWARVQDVVRPTDERGAQLALRLTELGFVPNEAVCVVARAALGGPLAVRVGQSTFALRRHEAMLVQVHPHTSEPIPAGNGLFSGASS